MNASLPGSFHLLYNIIIDFLQMKLIYTIIRNIHMIPLYVCLRVTLVILILCFLCRNAFAGYIDGKNRNFLLNLIIAF